MWQILKMLPENAVDDTKHVVRQNRILKVKTLFYYWFKRPCRAVAKWMQK